MASRNSDPKNKTQLYCDSFDKFSDDKFVYVNDVFYPIQNYNNQNRDKLFNKINSQEDEEVIEDNNNNFNNKKNNEILEGEILNNSNSISNNFLKLSFIIISLLIL